MLAYITFLIHKRTKQMPHESGQWQAEGNVKHDGLPELGPGLPHEMSTRGPVSELASHEYSDVKDKRNDTKI